ncbi:MAG: hypothetical protein QG661_3282, partial [Actinomycetota bacterium]|nr:hypothetical protein [Actinomycetota bacterium]
MTRRCQYSLAGAAAVAFLIVGCGGAPGPAGTGPEVSQATTEQADVPAGWQFATLAAFVTDWPNRLSA